MEQTESIKQGSGTHYYDAASTANHAMSIMALEEQDNLEVLESK